MKREAYMREGPDHDDDPMIMNVARVCASCGRRRLYPDAQCVKCTMNPALYTTQSRANLMRVNAALQFNETALQIERRSSQLSGLIMAIFCVVFLLSITLCSRECSSSRRAAQVYVSANDEIVRAIARTKADLHDVSGDGLINCQDYAMLFRTYYTGARIIYNPYIGPTGHLFNMITIGNDSFFVEPQAPNGKWLMEEAWDEWTSVASFSRDVTWEWEL